MEGSDPRVPVSPRFPSPVGVRRLGEGEEEGVPVYEGISYCDAVRRAGEGETLRVLPGSIRVCRWAPVVLGLKEPEGSFEEGLTPRLPYPTGGLLLAPLGRFPGEPEVVVVRAAPEVLLGMVEVAGRERLWGGHEGRLDRSALPALLNDNTCAVPSNFNHGDTESTELRGVLEPFSVFLSVLRASVVSPRRKCLTPVSARCAPRPWLIGAVNRALAGLARFRPWQALTHRLFRSGLVTAGFDALISRTLADMSICRNSTVVPLLTGRVNLSFFCTGGVTWGRNDPQQLTSGWPWDVYCGREVG